MDSLKILLARTLFKEKNNPFPRQAILLDDYQGRERLALGYYERDFINFLKSNLSRITNNPENTIFLDIGASYGTYALFFARYFNKVYAFEPGEESMLMLKTNISLNNINNINTQQIGLASFTGEGYLNIPEGDNGSAFITKTESINEDFRSYSIKVNKLDDAIQGDECNVGLIKIDAEGLEKEILQGAKTVLKQSNPVVMFEAHGELKAGGIIEELKSQGYVHFYELRQSRRTYNARILNIFSLLLFPRKISLFKLDKLVDRNYQLILAFKKGQGFNS